MQMLDWAALIQPTQGAKGSEESACNLKAVVTGIPVVTHNTSEINNLRACNHVTTETTKTEGGAGSPASDANNQPGGVWVEDSRAGSNIPGGPIIRPVLHYRLLPAHRGAGTIIGDPCDSRADLLQALLQHHGARLDLESVQ